MRGGTRFYGGTFEYNNSAAAATDLGVLERVFSPEWPVSIATGVDCDFYRFTIEGASSLSVTVDPVGFRYDSDGAVVQTDEIVDLAFRVLGGANGSEILIQVDEVDPGGTELLTDFFLPAAGDYGRSRAGTAARRRPVGAQRGLADAGAGRRARGDGAGAAAGVSRRQYR